MRPRFTASTINRAVLQNVTIVLTQEDMSHWALEELLAPIRRLAEEVRRKALMRLEYEGLAAGGSRGRAHDDPASYAMERYAYYVCHKCGKVTTFVSCLFIYIILTQIQYKFHLFF